MGGEKKKPDPDFNFFILEGDVMLQDDNSENKILINSDYTCQCVKCVLLTPLYLLCNFSVQVNFYPNNICPKDIKYGDDIFMLKGVSHEF